MNYSCMGNYRCPQCKGTDLHVEVAQWRKLRQFNGAAGPYATALDIGSEIYWDGSSQIQCQDCDYCSPADFFKVPG